MREIMAPYFVKVDAFPFTELGKLNDRYMRS